MDPTRETEEPSETSSTLQPPQTPDEKESKIPKTSDTMSDDLVRLPSRSDSSTPNPPPFASSSQAEPSEVQPGEREAPPLLAPIPRLPVPTAITVPAPSLSPPVVPLSPTRDPLMEDRLNVLDTIRNVLGEDVVRSLPVITQAREDITERLDRLRRERELLSGRGRGNVTESTVRQSERFLQQLREGSERNQQASGSDFEMDPSGSTQHPSLVSAVQTDGIHHPTEPGEPSSSSPPTRPLNDPAWGSNFAHTNPTTAITAATATASSTTTVPPIITNPGPISVATSEVQVPANRANFRNRVSTWLGLPPVEPSAVAVPSIAQESLGSGRDSTPRDDIGIDGFPGLPRVAHVRSGVSIFVHGFVSTSIRSEGAPDTSSTWESATDSAQSSVVNSQPSTAASASPAESPDAPAVEGGAGPAVSAATAPAGTPQERRRTMRSTLFGRRASEEAFVRTQGSLPFSEQARMLAGLLSVSTAATASSILESVTPTPEAAVDSTQNNPRAPPLPAALEALLNRVRAAGPARRRRRPFEEIMQEYLREDAAIAEDDDRDATLDTVLQNVEDEIVPENVPSQSSAMTGTANTSFEQFLARFRRDLVAAMQSPRGVDGINTALTTASAGATAAATPVSASTSGTHDAVTESQPPHTSPSVSTGSSTSEDPTNRLEFFRVFSFKDRTVRRDTDGENLVPTIVLGVRSLRRPLPTSNDEISACTNLEPFEMDESEVADVVEPEAAATPSESTTSADTSTTPGWVRALRSLTRLGRTASPAPPQQPTPPPVPTFNGRNYTLWIVGGYFPPSDPLLTISPTNTAQLNYETMWRFEDIVASVQPTTPTTEAIAKSDLETIKGRDVTKANEDGRIRSNTAEQCTICLSEYEDDEDCRIMSCKHLFHADCVDTWLKTGKNNCPACRTTGVTRKKRYPRPANAPPPID